MFYKVEEGEGEVGKTAQQVRSLAEFKAAAPM